MIDRQAAKIRLLKGRYIFGRPKLNSDAKSTDGKPSTYRKSMKRILASLIVAASLIQSVNAGTITLTFGAAPSTNYGNPEVIIMFNNGGTPGEYVYYPDINGETFTVDLGYGNPEDIYLIGMNWIYDGISPGTNGAINFLNIQGSTETTWRIDYGGYVNPDDPWDNSSWGTLRRPANSSTWLDGTQ